MNGSRRILLFALFATVQAALLIGLNWQTSLNRTEIGHLGAAVYFWKTGRFDVFHVNPPLTRIVAGLPIMLLGPEHDLKPYSPQPQDRSEWALGAAFVNANTPETVRWCVFWARCALIPFILLGGWFGYKFASELYNEYSGLIFLTFWTFSPLVLGWGATICPDVVAASLGIVAVYFFWRWLHSPSWSGAIAAGVTLGLLPLAKTTWVIALPIWIVLWLFWRVRRIKSEEPISLPGAKQFVTIILIAIYVLNMGYGFDGTCRSLKDYTFISKTLSGAGKDAKTHAVKPGNRFAETALGYVPVPLPGEFVQGIDTQKRDFETGLQSYFRGETSDRGWWYYYPYTLLIREPLGVWGLVLLTIGVSVFMRTSLNWRNEIMLLVPMVTILAVICSQTGFSIHPRYVILVLPFVYIWISKLGLLFSSKHKFVTCMTTVLLLWFVGSSLSYYPHTMSYFNESIGGAKNGPKHLLGSNVDWGQNLYFLKSWIKNHPEAKPLYVNYASTDSLQRLGVKDTKPVPQDRESGWYALDVNELYGTKQYDDFKTKTPTDRVGWGIYIYHIDERNE